MLPTERWLDLLALQEKDRRLLAEALARSFGHSVTKRRSKSALDASGTPGETAPEVLEDIQRPTFEDYLVWTDGSCPSNPGRGGWAAVIVGKDGEPKKISGGKEQTTNNEMEVTAILEGLKAVPLFSKVVVYSDSQYAIGALSRWYEGWMRNGWKKKDGTNPANVDLIKSVLELTECRKVVFEWVKGHSGDPMNEMCDRLAAFAVPCKNSVDGTGT